MAIRRAINAVTPELVSSYFAKTNKRWVEWGFLQNWASTGVAMGTDWTSGELYVQDWGDAFGPLVRFRYPGEAGLNCIFPRLRDGGAEVVVSVMPGEVEALKAEEGWGRYVS